MTDKEFLTNWLIKYGMEWVVRQKILSQMQEDEQDYLFELRRFRLNGCLEREDHSTRESNYRLTQRALDYINGH